MNAGLHEAAAMKALTLFRASLGVPGDPIATPTTPSRPAVRSRSPRSRNDRRHQPVASSIVRHSIANAAGVVLAGGRSTRMGTPKAALDWHGSTLVYRTAALVSRAVDGPVVVVAAPGQRLPELPVGVQIVEDPVEGLGPMRGIATGLAAVADLVPVAFVCSTDMPFLHPAFVIRVLASLR